MQKEPLNLDMYTTRYEFSKIATSEKKNYGISLISAEYSPELGKKNESEVVGAPRGRRARDGAEEISATSGEAEEVPTKPRAVMEKPPEFMKSNEKLCGIGRGISSHRRGLWARGKRAT